MPVTGTVGALSYARIETGENPNIVYWAVSTPNTNYIDFYFDSTENTFTLLSATNSNSIAVLTKINGTVNPVLDISRDYDATLTTPSRIFNILTGNSRICKNSIGNIVITGSAYANNPSSFPYLKVYTSMIARGNANIPDNPFPPTFTYTYPFYQYLATVDNQYWSENQAVLLHSNGNIWTGGFESGPTTGVAYPRAPYPTIKKFDIYGDYQQAYVRITTTGTSPNNFRNNTHFATLAQASDGNIIGYCNFETSSGPNDLYFVKINQTQSGNSLTNIWSTSYKGPNAFAATLVSTSMDLDANDNIFATGYQNTASFVVNLSNTGNMLWSKYVTNMRIFDGVVVSSNQYLVTGKTSTGSLWIAEYDNTGNINWQRTLSGPSITGSTANTTIDVYNNDMYIATNTLLIKLPANGAILGTGTYYFNNGSALTYATSSITQSNISLPQTTNTLYFPNDVGNTTGISGFTAKNPVTSANRAVII